jgi:acyl carrier protein
MQLENEIRRYVADNLLYVEEGLEYDDDTSFVGSGLIDSMGIMELVSYVQSNFQILVDQQDLVPDNFDSVSKVAAFIRGKQSAAAQAEGSNGHAGSARLREQRVSSAR